MEKHYTDFNSKPLARSLEEIKEMSKKSKDNYGCCNKPLLNTDLDHIIAKGLVECLLMCGRKKTLMEKKVVCMIGQVSWEMTRGYRYTTFQKK